MRLFDWYLRRSSRTTDEEGKYERKGVDLGRKSRISSGHGGARESAAPEPATGSMIPQPRTQR